MVYYAYALLLLVVVVSLAGFAWVAGWQKAKDCAAGGGAEIVIVRRQRRVNDKMKLNPVFRDLDAMLFPEQGRAGVLENLAESFPLRV